MIDSEFYYKKFERILKSQITPGILIFIFGTIAFFISNSKLKPVYDGFFHEYLSISIGPIFLKKTFHDWINEFLMAIFFLMVTLEIKREFFYSDHKHSASNKLILSAIASIGGVIIPALIFYAFNFHDQDSLKGWAVPTATDIVFALSILLLLGNRVPLTLKILLITIATFDDIIAILIIGTYYSSNLELWFIFYAGLVVLLLEILNIYQVRSIFIYLLTGLIMWFCILNSGIHATLSGVILAIFIPGNIRKSEIESPLHKLEKILYPLVYFLILPLFAFANTGISVLDLHLDNLFNSLPVSIVLGLFLGKQIGIFGFSLLAIKLKITKISDDINLKGLYGISILCGIGFTMSLLIGNLAYSTNPELLLLNRIGILIGSMISAIVGYFYLRNVLKTNKTTFQAP